MGECGADEVGFSREFYSDSVDDSYQPITEECPGARFEILSIKPEKWVGKTVSIRYFRKLGFISVTHSSN